MRNYFSLLEKARLSDRKLRLFSCACCRRLWDLLPTDECHSFIIAVEDFSDGKIAEPALKQAMRSAIAASSQLVDKPGRLAVKQLARSFYKFDPLQCAMFVPMEVDQGFRLASGTERPHDVWECDVAQDIIGPPSEAAIAFDVLWQTPEVLALAQAMYDARRFDRMEELAFALEEAGCSDKAILEHCQSVIKHVRGCWVIDLILGHERRGVSF